MLNRYMVNAEEILLLLLLERYTVGYSIEATRLYSGSQ